MAFALALGLAAPLASCGPGQEEIDAALKAVLEHVKTVKFNRYGGLFTYDGLKFVDLRNSAAPRKGAIAIRMVQHDGKKKPTDPEDMPKARALKRGEAALRREICPPKSLTQIHDDFSVYLSILSTRYNDLYRVACPL